MNFAKLFPFANADRRRVLRFALFACVALLTATAGLPQLISGRVGAASTQSGVRTRTLSSEASSKHAAKFGGARTKSPDDSDVQPSLFCGTQTPIAFGQTINASLSTADCRFPDGTYYDEYTFTANSGQQIRIEMSSTDFDTYLFLFSPSDLNQPNINEPLAENDNISSTNRNSRIPVNASAFITLPETGMYTIVANTNSPTLSATSNNYTLTLTAAAGECPSTPINFGETKSGGLATTDCRLPDETPYDPYTFNGIAGQQVAISMNTTSSTFNPYLYLLAPDRRVLREDDNSGGGRNARIPDATGFFTLPETGRYIILANVFPITGSTATTGNYTLTLTSTTVSCSFTLASNSQAFPTSGGTGSVNVTASDASCSRTATSNVPWITITGGATGTGSGTVTYNVAANTGAARTGTITIAGQTFTVTQEAATLVCSFALASNSQAFPTSGGTGSISVTASDASCSRTATSNVPWITITGGATGAGNGTVTYNVAANTGAARTGTITVAGQTFTVTQEAVQLVCTYALSAASQTVSALGGNLSFGVTTQAGCPLAATSNVAWIIVNSASADANGAGTVSYTVQANSETQNRTGAITLGGQTHTVTQTSAALPPPTVRFSAATFMTAENDATRVAAITVERTGDASGTATIEIATVDDPAAVPCDPTVRDGAGNLFPQGRAYARCDYATTIDIVTFPAGDTQPRRFTIPLINDVHVEGNETLQLVLRNPQGATIGTQATATLTIIDDDANVSATNPINQTPFFVRQQYLDFLSREPEPGEPWTGVLNRCPNVNNLDPRSPSAECDRILVSFSFFGSPEFRLKGFFVFLHYKASFGSAANPNYVPTYEQIVPDLRRVTGQTAEEVFAKRLQFTADWVTRPEFVSAYPATLSAAAFVDRLLSNVGATLTTADNASGVTRNSLVADLEAGRRTRADVLRLIVESNEATAVQFSRAFVAIQYYGYLRRTPEAAGYQSWLNVINNQNEDAATRNRTMINGFMNSAEYRLRFGPNTLQ